jgi:signal peptidase I
VTKPDPTPPPTSNAVAAARADAKAPNRTWENVKSILGTIALFLVLRTFLIEAYRIPSGSMIPSLLIGDWLFVNKLRYGPHVPFTDINLPGYAEPTRGDVAVFKSPVQVDQPWDPTPTLVKRIVGVPGDTLHMRGGMLYLNGEPQPQAHQPVPLDDGMGGERSPLFVWQAAHTLQDSRFGPAPAPTLNDWGPLLVPPGYYFMLGDARHGSKDSRFWGIVPRENFRGRPLFVYYSYNADDSDRPLPALTDIRWGRIGHIIR